MAEFDDAGFSAVDNFFGDSPQDSEQTANIKTLQASAKSQGKKKRQGLGSTKTLPTNNNEELSKRLLKVGRKRLGDGDDYEMEMEAEAKPLGDQSDDDEEETGRTGITPSKKPAVSKSNTDLIEEGEETKKLGKKERKRRKLEEEAAKTSNDAKEETTAETHDDKDNSGSKRKRRKIRSRQKNIRKDNRATEEKPKHLLPGKFNYQGRPLTEETRRKLNLPPPSLALRQNFVIDRSPADTQEGTKLAVDQFLTDDQPTELPTEKPIKAKKSKKKSKYKNLAV
jgi:hypothetical protein